MSVIQLAKQQVAAEISAGPGRHHATAQKKKGPTVVEGELRWLGEFYDPHEPRPSKLSRGDKQVLDPAEARCFHRTPFERGYTEYIYEGTMRVVRSSADDPQASLTRSRDGMTEVERIAADQRDPRNSMREGQGVLRYPNGETYEGGWKSNRRHGEGCFSSPKGYRYLGEWKDDIKNGHGHEKFSSRSTLEATFDYGLPTGVGVLVYTAPSYRYEGEFKDGRRHGKGLMLYDNGDVFAGTWDCGRRQGRGVTSARDPQGKEIQYETEWDQDKLVGGPTLVEKGKRTRKPKAEVKYNVQGLMPADLTKWKVKDDLTELPMEHFLRIKMGFERLDDNGSGSLSTKELEAIWGDDSRDMLRKLDTDGNGTVELDEIFAGWYPNVPQHNVQRFMQLDINPKIILRLRGFLCGVRDDIDAGYLQIVGVKNPDDDKDDRPMLLKQLDTAGYKVGGERFTLAMYEASTVLCDPPHFAEVLETWYPNIPRNTLVRYELQEIPKADLDAIRTQFYALSNGKPDLAIGDFEAAQERWRSKEVDDNMIIDSQMVDGFFKGQPFWPLGSILISVQLLKDVDKFDGKLGGFVGLQQLLRYCFPNVRCKKTQEQLTGKRKVGVVPCTCQICSVN